MMCAWFSVLQWICIVQFIAEALRCMCILFLFIYLFLPALDFACATATNDEFIGGVMFEPVFFIVLHILFTHWLLGEALKIGTWSACDYNTNFNIGSVKKIHNQESYPKSTDSIVVFHLWTNEKCVYWSNNNNSLISNHCHFIAAVAVASKIKYMKLICVFNLRTKICCLLKKCTASVNVTTWYGIRKTSPLLKIKINKLQFFAIYFHY